MMVPGKQNRHPPHIPLTASGRIPRPRYPNMNKPRHPPNKKRRVKPMRGSMIAHSMKHEVIVPAPSAAIGKLTTTISITMTFITVLLQELLPTTINLKFHRKIITMTINISITTSRKVI